MDANPGRRQFGEYLIDLDTGELRRNGKPVALQRQPAVVLTRLVARAGALVRREELQAAVWGNDVHVDFDRGLNYCIRQLREALADDARAPRFIETVARQGYRFVALVQPFQPVAVQHRRLPRKPRRPLVAAAVLVLMIGLKVADSAMGHSEQHHRLAIALAKTIHDVVF